ncbi:MAG TPA: antibiotic biosynthesis monooxygenase [Gammaproteobacteria bacterium]|nr:antibiotic biosynthesis monooxygenase [Gammaproteobacteria bacterium]
MYAVIFRAKVADIDEEYGRTAERMRRLAIEKYGSTGFTSVTEDGEEISISYWKTQEQIKAWKNDTEHIAAQELGKSRWYRWYKVQIVEIVREYEGNT